MVNGKYSDTEEGTPQGGIISPTLCNVALNGMEKAVKSRFYYKDGRAKAKGTWIKLIRYADDVIVTGRTPEVLKEIKEILREFLKIRGLEMSEAKTRITHIRRGINFLGFFLQKVKYNPSRNPEAMNTLSTLIGRSTTKGKEKLKEKIKKKNTILFFFLPPLSERGERWKQ
jgi:RNA-directed DNA polymerase